MPDLNNHGDFMAILRQEVHKQQVIGRLKRVEGQIRGVQNMIDDNSECEKIAQQILASRKALERAFHHLMACVIAQETRAANILDAGADAQLERLTAVLAKFS
jgi:CsoR family transcriptional regulator, copper-sensing transcriptional repressor